MYPPERPVPPPASPPPRRCAETSRSTAVVRVSDYWPGFVSGAAFASVVAMLVFLTLGGLGWFR